MIDSHACVTYQDTIFLFGGFLAGEMACYSNNTYRFDTNQNTLTQVNSKGVHPEPRSDHCAAVLDNNMYIFGGISGEHQFNDIWKLNLGNFEWTKIKTTGESPSQRIGHASTAAGKYILIFGGNNEINYENTNMWLMDTETNGWLKLGDNMKICSKEEENKIDPEDFLEKKLTKSSLIENEMMRVKSPKKKRKPHLDKSQPPSPTKHSTRRKKHAKTMFLIPNNSHRGNKLESSRLMKNSSVIHNHAKSMNTLQNSTTKSQNMSQYHLNKISQTKALKRARLKKQKAQEKESLLNEFALTPQEKQLEIEDPFIQKMKNTLEALAPDDKSEKSLSEHHSPLKSPKKSKMKRNAHKTMSSLHGSVLTTRQQKSPSKNRRIGQGKSVLRPGIALFGQEVESKVEACCLPRLDGCRVHFYGNRIFVFGGDRSGLCSNDLYCMTDDGQIWSKKNQTKDNKDFLVVKARQIRLFFELGLHE